MAQKNGQHLKALLRKNWILWKRNLVCSILEILIPSVFVLCFQLLRTLQAIKEFPEKSYIGEPYSMTGDFQATEARRVMRDCQNGDTKAMVALYPQSNSFVTTLNTYFTNLGFQTQYFTSRKEIDDYTSTLDYGRTKEPLCFGVFFEDFDNNNQYEYSLIFNNTSNDESDIDVPGTNFDLETTIQKEDLANLLLYQKQGFLAVQNWVDNLIIQREVGNNAAKIDVDVTSVKTPDYTQDDLVDTIENISRIFIAIPILLPYVRMVAGMLKEKEKRIKEGMKIMGMSNSAFFMSWLITYFLIFTIISLLIAIFMCATVLKKSNFFMVFTYHWVFSLAAMAMGTFCSVFFSKAKSGSVIAFVFAFATGWFENFVIGSTDKALKTLVSLGPATSVSLATQQIFKLEAAEVGLTSSTSSVDVNGYNMNIHYMMTMIYAVVFFILAFYLDQVLPSEFGVKKHPLFCLKRSKKGPSKANDVEDSAIKYIPDGFNTENYEDVDPSLKTQDQNNETVRVKNLQKVYPNGKLAVDEVSFNMYKGQIFALLGHNGAGKTSTINMITGLYPTSSGTTTVFGKNINGELDDVRKTMGVCPQHDVLFDQLTVQEHLELFATFKGMDKAAIPAAVDKIIKDLDFEEKRNYLTKDLSGGQKRKLSTGIAFIGDSKFILLDEPSSGMDATARRKIWEMLKTYKQGKVILLTTHFMDEADFLGDRIAIMGDGKIQCIGRSLFLKKRFGVGYSLTIVKESNTAPYEPIVDLVTQIIPEAKCTTHTSAEITMQLPDSTSSKFEELFIKLDQHLKQLAVSSYGMSVTTLEEVFLNVAKENTIRKIGKIEKELTQKDDLDDFDLIEDRMKNNWEIFKTQFSALVQKRLRYFKRDGKGLFLELIFPALLVIVGILFTLTNRFKQGASLNFTDDIYGLNKVAYNNILPSNTALDANFVSNFEPTASYDFASKSTNTLSAFDQVVFDERAEYRKWSFFMSNFAASTAPAANKQYKYHMLIDSRAYHVAPLAMNRINNAILRYATGNSNSKIVTKLAPFDVTESVKAIEASLDGVNLVFVIAIGISLLPASIIAFIVRERETNVKHQQLVSGMKTSAYWSSNFFIDIFKFFIPAILIGLVAMAMDAESLIEGNKLGAFWLLLIMYGFSLAPFVYVTSFAFKNFASAQTATFYGHFALGFIGSTLITTLRFFDGTKDPAQIIAYFLRIVPTYSLCQGFNSLINLESLSRFGGQSTSLSPWDMSVTGADFLMMGLTTVLYTILLFVIEGRQNKRSIFNKDVPVDKIPEDSDVINEKKMVEASSKNDMDIRVNHIRKVFNLPQNRNKVAVNDISFGIKNGECFVLLGVNGAGKTTTFKMLTGEIQPTKGEISIKGNQLPDQIVNARLNIGYCPQFDALLDNLTAKEHLELYAQLKGIPIDKRAPIVQKLLKELNLKQFENIPAGTYSGGNKRKLSVAIAMVGNPPIVFLDEPSTGMDPEARRFMWNVISKISTQRKHSSVILTTHSMEEAEALATKIGIQVDGNMMCMGSSQHIKNKYGGGFELEIKITTGGKEEAQKIVQEAGYQQQSLRENEVKEFLSKLGLSEKLEHQITQSGSGSSIYIELQKGNVPISLLADWIAIEKRGFALEQKLKEAYGELSLVEHFETFYRFRIDSKVSLGSIFGFLEKNKGIINVDQYSVKQTSIEQIFNGFANGVLKVKASDETIPKNNDHEIAIPINNIQNNAIKQESNEISQEYADNVAQPTQQVKVRSSPTQQSLKDVDQSA